MTALDALLARWDVRAGEGACASILRGMASLPYENLSKILEDGRVRTDEEVARDHLESGTGGTCFALVSLFLALARRAGLEARPVFADRSYGPDTHCAAIVGSKWLADPGFLVHVPVPLEPGTVELPFARLALDGDGSVWTVFANGHRKFRHRLKLDRVSDADFRLRWDDSFEWPMMGQPVVTRVVGEAQVYLRDRFRHEVRRTGSSRRELAREEVVAEIERLGIARPVVERALWRTSSSR